MLGCSVDGMGQRIDRPQSGQIQIANPPGVGASGISTGEDIISPGSGPDQIRGPEYEGCNQS